MSSVHRCSAAALCLGMAVCVLTACSSDDRTAHRAARVSVVASTDVYGNIATLIGGADIDVSSLITSPSQDPHSFEANAHDELAVSKADVLIENGGGYDDFMATLRRSAGAQSAQLIDVVGLSGKHAAGGQLNEHVWYDFATVRRFALRLAAVLSAKDPASRSTFQRNAASFVAQLQRLRGSEARLASTYGGDGVAITEPVPLYLLEACGLVNRTPEQFSGAVEEDTGVPVSVLHETVALFTTHTVRLLVYNAQTAGPETSTVLAAAKANAVPVVGVTETLPAGKSYLGWMTANVAAVGAALAAAGRS